MTKGVLFLLALLPLFFLPSPTYARGINFKADVSAIRAGCSKAGGNFQTTGQGGGAIGYGCTKTDCDGKGGNCVIACDNNNNCTGSTPARVDARTGIVSVMNNGWNRSDVSESGGGSGGGRETTSSGGNSGTGASGDNGGKDTGGGGNKANDNDNSSNPGAGNTGGFGGGGGGGVIY